MPESSLKSDVYSSFLQDAAVPSTPLCFFIIFLILRSYEKFSGKYGIIFSSFFLILFILTMFHTLSGYRYFFYNKKTVCFTAVFIILLFSLTAFYLSNKINNLTSGDLLPDYIENVEAVIDEINFKRYSSEIYFHTAGGDQKELKGIIYYQGDQVFNIGDSIFLHKKIIKTDKLRKSAFGDYLISRGIHFSAGITDSDLTLIKKNDAGFRSNLQNVLLKRIDSIFKNPAAGVIKALMTGNQNYIEKNIILRFRDSGVLHCLSASGLHVAIFAAIPAFFLLNIFGKNIAMSGSLLSVLFYLFITDIPVPLLRAVLMFVLFYFQSIFFRKKNVFNCLMLTCSIILLATPWEIFSPGFQLSFAATAGILVFYKPYRQSLKDLPGVFADTTAVTLSAQIITLPIILFHMKQLNTAGILSNIVIVPMITMIMGIAMFTILISFFSISAAVLSGNITCLFLKFNIFLTNYISDLKLNFYVYDITPLLLLFILLSVLPLINHKKILLFKFYPVVLSALLCTFYMKKYYQLNNSSFTIRNDKSTADIIVEENKQILKLDLKEEANIDEIVRGIYIKNPDIRIIHLADNCNSNILVSKKILNDFIIDEFRIAHINELNKVLKNTIIQLEKDNIAVKFQ